MNKIVFHSTCAIPIDLKKEREHIDFINKSDCPFSKKETENLLKLLAIIETGEIEEAFKFYQKLTRDEKEYTSCEVIELFDHLCFSKYKILEIKKAE